MQVAAAFAIGVLRGQEWEGADHSNDHVREHWPF